MKEAENYTSLWDALDSSVEANLKFARLVINQEPKNIKFFFGPYSYEILKWISLTVFSAKGKDVEENIYQIYGDYFEFVSNPIDDKNRPEWYQLTSYKGKNGLKLKSWLMNHSHQYFARKKMISDKLKSNEDEILEYIDYEALLGIGDSMESLSDEECVYRERLAKAWAALSDKDKNILRILVIEKTNWKRAFDEIREYINPRDGMQVIESWNDKRKQDALAMLKIRAVTHLRNRFNQVKS